jgi:hypothetical protein
MDFTEADGAIWPMYVEQGGESYGFCPGKATWDFEAASTFKMLIISAETGRMIEEGGLYDQPDWWIDLLASFLPRYDQQKFFSRAKAVLGDPKVSKAMAKVGRQGSQGAAGGNNR